MLEVAPKRSIVAVDCILLIYAIGFEVCEEIERLLNDHVERFFESRFSFDILSGSAADNPRRRAVVDETWNFDRMER